MIHFQIFKKFPQIIYGLSTRKDGSMKLTGQKEKDKKALRNRQKFLSLFNLKIKDVVWAQLDHQGKVKTATLKNRGQWIKNIDGFISKDKNLYLSLTMADCFPVFFFESEKGIVALVHASWRAIIRGIIERIIEQIKMDSGQVKNILMAIGPGIRPCHFEVKEKVARKFLTKFSQKVLIKKRGKIFIDLPLTIKLIALKSGILPRNIEELRECTYCLKNKYFSFRRDKPKKIKAMMTLIGLKT